MGLNFVVDEKDRLPQLNAVYIPDGVDDAATMVRAIRAAPAVRVKRDKSIELPFLLTGSTRSGCPGRGGRPERRRRHGAGLAPID